MTHTNIKQAQGKGLFNSLMRREPSRWKQWRKEETEERKIVHEERCAELNSPGSVFFVLIAVRWGPQQPTAQIQLACFCRNFIGTQAYPLTYNGCCPTTFM